MGKAIGFTSFWAQLDQMKREHDGMKERVRAYSGWRFKGRKPDGRWWARRSWGKRALDVFGGTSAELLKELAAFFCRTCGHPVCKHKEGTCHHVMRFGRACPCKAKRVSTRARGEEARRG